jgi:NADPH:quinone reductase-like Zn-dependent oxidoreductase
MLTLLFHKGYEAPISSQPEAPGLQHKLPVEAINDALPTASGGSQPYLAAGKLKGKKALITGGDSGIGRAVAILYAMEGAQTTIVYLAVEEKDAQETARLVREKGGVIQLVTADLKNAMACKNVVEKAADDMGGIDILVLNHGTQNMVEDIKDLTE